MEKKTGTSPPSESLATPARATQKRKAEEEVVIKTAEKKGRVSYTPGAATRSLKRATPARTKATSASQKEGMTAPESSKTMEKLFRDLGDSLTVSLTKKMSEDFKASMSTVNERVESNTKSIEKINEAIARIENNQLSLIHI